MIKNLLNKIKPKEIPFDPSRRKIIRDAAGLAALTVVATQIPSFLKKEAIKKQIISGNVNGETFYLYEPIVIDIDHISITNCRFIAMVEMPYMVSIEANYTTISGCYFESKAMTGAAIGFDI